MKAQGLFVYSSGGVPQSREMILASTFPVILLGLAEYPAFFRASAAVKPFLWSLVRAVCTVVLYDTHLRFS